jgi:hypothetical protein
VAPPWRLALLRGRSAARAWLHLIRTWWQAGRVEPDGPVSPPETGTPPGGPGSPGLAQGDVPDALEPWVPTVAKAHGRGAARRCRSAEDGVGACRSQAAAERFSRGLPQRREQCPCPVAPEQTPRLRCRRLPPRCRGHDNDSGGRGTSRVRPRFCNWAMDCTFQGRNRRGGTRRSVLWEPCPQRLDRVQRARPRMTAGRRRSV